MSVKNILSPNNYCKAYFKCLDVSNNAEIHGDLTVDGTINGHFAPGTITPGAAGQILYTNNTATAAEWKNFSLNSVPSGLTGHLQFLESDPSNVVSWQDFSVTNIPPSNTNNQVLTTIGGVTTWANPSGSSFDLENTGAGTDLVKNPNGNPGYIKSLTSTDTTISLSNTTDTINLAVNLNGIVADTVSGNNLSLIQNQDESASVACGFPAGIDMTVPGGNITMNATGGQITMNAANFEMFTLPNATKSNIVYYDTTSKLLSYGSVAGSNILYQQPDTFNPPGNIISLVGSGDESTQISFFNVPNLLIQNTNNAGAVQIFSTGTNGQIHMQSNGALDMLSLADSNNLVASDGSGNMSLSGTTSILLSTPSLLVNGIPNSSAADVLYYDPIGRGVSYNTIHNATNILGQVASTVTVGSNSIEFISNANQTNQVDCNTGPTSMSISNTNNNGTILIDNSGTTATTTIQANNTGSSININSTGVGNQIAITSNGQCSITDNSNSNQIQVEDGSGNINITAANNVTITMTSGNINITVPVGKDFIVGGLRNAVTTHPVYYNTTTGAFSYGP